MSDHTPQLMVTYRCDDCGNEDHVREALASDVPQVVVWLREQGAGEEVLLEWDGELWVWDDEGDWVDLAVGRYLVVPLDTEPPKETE